MKFSSTIWKLNLNSTRIELIIHAFVIKRKKKSRLEQIWEKHRRRNLLNLASKITVQKYLWNFFINNTITDTFFRWLFQENEFKIFHLVINNSIRSKWLWKVNVKIFDECWRKVSNVLEEGEEGKGDKSKKRVMYIVWSFYLWKKYISYKITKAISKRCISFEIIFFFLF